MNKWMNNVDRSTKRVVSLLKIGTKKKNNTDKGKLIVCLKIDLDYWHLVSSIEIRLTSLIFNTRLHWLLLLAFVLLAAAAAASNAVCTVSVWNYYYSLAVSQCWSTKHKEHMQLTIIIEGDVVKRCLQMERLCHTNIHQLWRECYRQESEVKIWWMLNCVKFEWRNVLFVLLPLVCSLNVAVIGMVRIHIMSRQSVWNYYFLLLFWTFIYKYICVCAFVQPTPTKE